MSKNYRKNGQTFLQRECFFVSCEESFFGQGSAEMSKECTCKVSRLCHFRTCGFFEKKVTRRRWTDTLLPRSLSWVPLLLLWIYGMPMQFYGDSAARSAKRWPPVTLASARPRARSGCRRPYRQEICVSYVKSSCDVISHDLFLCHSSLSSVERLNKKIQFLSKPNQTSTLLLPTCENWVHSKNWFLCKKFVKDFTFGSGCTVATTSRIAAPKRNQAWFFDIPW